MLGVIDIGSNSTRLVVFDSQFPGEHRVVAEVKATLRLQRHILPDGTLEEAAVDDLVSHLKDFAAVSRARGATRTRAVATSAVRQATNGEHVLARVRRETGLDLTIISGDEEARLAFAGAVYGLPVEQGVLVDIGGGSMELVRFRDRKMVSSATLPLGALKVTDQFLRSDPPTRKEITQLGKHAECLMVEAGVSPLRPGESLVVTGGTVRNLAKVDRRVVDRRFGRLHGYVIPADRLRKLVGRLRGMTAAQRGDLKGLSAERADSILGGALSLLAAVKLLQADSVQVSGKGLREGLATEYGDSVLPPVEAVRAQSISALSAKFGTWSAQRAAVKGVVAAQLVSVLDGALAPEMARLVSFAAAIVDAGSTLDYYNRFEHAARIVETGDIRGFTRREIALIAAALLFADDSDASPSVFGNMLSSEDVMQARLAGVLTEVCEQIEFRLTTNAESSLDVRRDGDRLLVRAPGLGNWRPGKLATRFEEAFGVKLVVENAVP
jgi:exopolyphosphatase/guanosine-5'-triphosphate,3'-diphosphate pyrophosphatase